MTPRARRGGRGRPAPRNVGLPPFHRRIVGAALACAACLAAGPPGMGAQETPSRSQRTHFASFDVGVGGTKPVDAEWGLSYGVASDVANLVVRGASMRFGFRFWASDSRDASGRAVDIDDAVFDIVLKKHLGPESLGAYAGLGVGLHVIDARYGDFSDEKEERDGARFGLQGILGLQKPVVDEGFISLFLEGQGSLVADISHGVLHVGVRIRFDRLGTGG